MGNSNQKALAFHPKISIRRKFEKKEIYIFSKIFNMQTMSLNLKIVWSTHMTQNESRFPLIQCECEECLNIEINSTASNIYSAN